MQPSTLILAAMLGASAPAVFAQATDPADEHAAHRAAPAETTQPKAEHDHGTARESSAQGAMQPIEALMREIQATTDPEAKRALLAKHLEAMLVLARSLHPRPTDDAPTAKPPEGKSGMGGMKGGGMMKMHEKMDQRVEQLERLLLQMLEREAVEDAASGH